MDFIRAFKTFFGINPDKLEGTVIITNINPIFYGLIEQSVDPYPSYKGFYDCTKVKFNNGIIYDLIKITSGNNIIDVLKLITNYVSNVIFIGIAGSLSTNDPIGTVCVPDEFAHYSLITEKHDNVICQTSGLIQSDEFYFHLQNCGVKWVDMECFDVYNICQCSGTKLKYIVQISDMPLVCPFYDSNFQPIKIDSILDIIYRQ